MAIGIVLDPRYKIDLLDYFFPQIYGDQSDCEIEKVKILFKDLVREYEINMKGKKLVSSCQNPNINICQSVDGRKDAWRRDFAKHQIEKKSEPSNYKLELDYYFEEPTLPDSDEEFDILVWWKAPLFPFGFSLFMGIRRKDQEKYVMTLCVLSKGRSLYH